MLTASLTQLLWIFMANWIQSKKKSVCCSGRRVSPKTLFFLCRLGLYWKRWSRGDMIRIVAKCPAKLSDGRLKNTNKNQQTTFCMWKLFFLNAQSVAGAPCDCMAAMEMILLQSLSGIIFQRIKNCPSHGTLTYLKFWIYGEKSWRWMSVNQCSLKSLNLSSKQGEGAGLVDSSLISVPLWQPLMCRPLMDELKGFPLYFSFITGCFWSSYFNSMSVDNNQLNWPHKEEGWEHWLALI